MLNYYRRRVAEQSSLVVNKLGISSTVKSWFVHAFVPLKMFKVWVGFGWDEFRTDGESSVVWMDQFSTLFSNLRKTLWGEKKSSTD